MQLISLGKMQQFLLEPAKNACDIVVLGHNRSDMSAQCLYQLFSIDPGVPQTITFVDNASTDSTQKLLRWYRMNTNKWVPWAKHKNVAFRTIRNRDNLSFSSANNNAAALGKSPWILFLNNDVILPKEKHWLGQLIACATHNGWAAIGPVSNAVLGIQSDYWNGEWPLTHRSKFLSGFCMVVRREIFEAVGGWDERFFYGDEDLDLSIKIRKAGWQVGVNRMVHVQHINQATMTLTAAEQGLIPDQWYAKTRNQLSAKWGEPVIRDLFIWPELTVPREKWRDYGVLPDGFFSFFPGSPRDGCRRLHKLRSWYPPGNQAGNRPGTEIRQLLGRYRFAGNDDVYRAACGDTSLLGNLELAFADCEPGGRLEQ